MSDRPRVLLAHSYFLAYDAKQVRKMKPYPPLATLVTAAVVRQSQHEVSLFDAMLASGWEEFEAKLDEVRPDVVGLLEDNFNFLSKMCTTQMREAALRMVDAAHRRGCRVAVNGADASDHPELYLGAGADAVILGESERTFPELLQAWSENEESDLAPIQGLVFSTAGGLQRTRARPFVEDLDSLPFPAWDLVDVPRYREAWRRAHGRFSWNMVTTRGCPYRCNWCAKPLYGARYAQRSPQNVAAELRLLAETVAPDHVWFADDIFGLTKHWIETFSGELSRIGVRIPFSMQSRVDLMTPSAAVSLERSGAEEVWMGVESGSQKILDAMEKGTHVEQVRAATRALRSCGIRASWFLQLGYPGEEWNDILKTRDLVRQERPDDVGVSVSYPLPGTAFYERVKDQLGSQRNWSDSDDLAMMFEGTYSGAFYRRVRDLLHAEATPGSETPRERRALDQAWLDLAREESRHRSALPTCPPATCPPPALPARLDGLPVVPSQG